MIQRRALSSLKYLKPIRIPQPLFSTTPQNQKPSEFLNEVNEQQYNIAKKSFNNSIENFQENITQTIQDMSPSRISKKQEDMSIKQPQAQIDIESELHDMKIYQNHSSSELLNLMMSNHILKYEFLVKNSEKLYRLSSKTLGSSITNFFINNSVGKVFTGGEALENMTQIRDDLQKKNVGIIVNYCDEACGIKITEEKMDRTTEKFIATIAKAQELDSAIGVKYSAICDPDIMRKINDYKIQSKKLFQQLCLDNNNSIINGKQLLEGLQKSGIDCNESQLKQFLTKILEKNNVDILENVNISRVQWETLVHPYYIESSKNNLDIIQKLYPFAIDEIPFVQNIIRRLDAIYQQGIQNPKSRIYVDAEQSYFQEFIESVTVQYQLKYNTQEPMIYSTIQCYLKDSRDKVQMEILKQKEFNITLGLKLVKGAYINEEKNLPAASNLNDGFDATSECYKAVAKTAIDNMGDKNEVLIALHNLQNAQDIASYIKQNKKDVNRVQFAQLLGMADFLSFSLPQQGFKTSKYVPFGETEIMIPYLCRRAYEGFKFMNNVILAENLIKDELKSRVGKKQQ